MEDLLLAGVHELKVEIWDERLQKYTTPGHLENYLIPSGNNTISIPGDYHQQRRVADEIENGNAAPQDDFIPDTDNWGPEGSSIGVFDTWHPGIDRLSVAGSDPRPTSRFATLHHSSPQAPLAQASMVWSLHPIPKRDRQTGRADNRGYWQPNTPYLPGDIVFVPWTDTNTDNLFAWSELPEPKFQIALRCVGTQNTATSAATPPTFPNTPGRRVRELNNDIEWESIDNRRPLRSLRLTIRYHDQSTDTQRTLSLVIPLTDKNNTACKATSAFHPTSDSGGPCPVMKEQEL
ncbi:MAG UNVERIFIED_CONTAM: hypothetical protein LVR18_21065 [Planctomycetaceae bacterium]|jgi:hypothetical protein